MRRSGRIVRRSVANKNNPGKDVDLSIDLADEETAEENGPGKDGDEISLRKTIDKGRSYLSLLRKVDTLKYI